MKKHNQPRIAAVTFAAATGMLMAISPVWGPLSRLPSAQNATGPAQVAAAPFTFLEAFDGRPTAPTPWRSDTWDITVHDNDQSTLNEMNKVLAHHGPDCAGPPATHISDGSFESVAFLCNDHMMTAISGGYALVSMTPPVTVDFSGSEAVIKVDVSTLRMETRDWWEIQVTPFEGNLQLAGNEGHEPLDAIIVRMIHTREDPGFNVYVRRAGQVTQLNALIRPHYTDWLQPSASRRDTFELRLRRDHATFGMPAYGKVMYDADFAPLNWTQGVVQLSHHAYNSGKDCEGLGLDPSVCGPGTWHWDNVSIAPAERITLLKGDRRAVDRESVAAGQDTVRFAGPAPAGSFLRFAGLGPVDFSVDGGASWQRGQVPNPLNHPGHPESYFTPIPAGVTSVRFRSAEAQSIWFARDVSVWSRAAGSGTVPSQPLPPATLPAPTATTVPTTAPLPTATLPAPTAVPTTAPQPTTGPQPTTVPAPQPTTVPNAHFTSRATANSLVWAGTTASAQIAVTSGTEANVNLSLEVYGKTPTGPWTKAIARPRENQSFSAGQTRQYYVNWQVPANTPAGTIYVVKVGVFSTDWATLHDWNDSAVTVTTR